MSKAGRLGRIMLLVLTILSLTGATQIAHAQTLNGFTAVYSHACYSSKNINNSCLSDNKNCSLPVKIEPKQVQSAVVVATTNTTPASTAVAANLPAAPALTSAYASDSAVLDSDKIFNLVNEYRASQGLAAFQKEDSVCSLAQTRSNEIPGEIQSGVLHSGLYNRNLPYWIWENAKIGTNEEGTVAWWLASPIHHQSIVGDYKYSCVRCTGSSCSQLFTSFVPK